MAVQTISGFSKRDKWILFPVYTVAAIGLVNLIIHNPYIAKWITIPALIASLVVLVLYFPRLIKWEKGAILPTYVLLSLFPMVNILTDSTSGIILYYGIALACLSIVLTIRMAYLNFVGS